MALLTEAAASSAVTGIARFLTVLVLFAAVLWATWAATKWLAGYQRGKWSGGNIEMLESFRIASDKYVQILRVADQYLAVAVAKDSVTLLAKLDKEALRGQEASSEKSRTSFRELLEKVREKKEE